MRRVVVVVVVVARDVVAVPHARCPRVHRAWTRAEVASAIAVRVAVCRVESNRIESDKPLAGVFVGGAGETRDAGREGTDATKEAEDERPIGSSMTNVTLDVTRMVEGWKGAKTRGDEDVEGDDVFVARVVEVANVSKLPLKLDLWFRAAFCK